MTVNLHARSAKFDRLLHGRGTAESLPRVERTTWGDQLRSSLACILSVTIASAQSPYSRVEVETLRPDPPNSASLLGWPLVRSGSEILAGAHAFRVSHGLVRRYEVSGGSLRWIGDIVSPFASQTSFGNSMAALGDDTLYVAAPRYDAVPYGLGAVLEFQRSPSNEWVQSQLVSLSVDAYGIYPIVVDTSQLIIGAGAPVGFGPSVHVFDRDPATGVLVAGQILRAVVALNATFGSDLAFAHDVLAVSAEDYRRPGPSQPETGAVEVFRRVAGQWQFEAFLESPSPGFARHFGHDITITDDGLRILVSEPGIIIAPHSPGRVFEFTYRGGQTWVLTQTLHARSPYPGDSFGSSIYINGDQLVVGSTEPLATGAIGGEAEVFQRDSFGHFQSTEVLVPASHGQAIHFGSFALSFGRTLLVTDHNRMYTTAAAGAIELFQRPLGSQICGSTTTTASRLEVFASDGVDTSVPVVRLVDSARPNALRFLVLGRSPSPPGTSSSGPLCVAGGAVLRVFADETIASGNETEGWFLLDAPWYSHLHGQRYYLQGVTLGGGGGLVVSPGIEYGG